MLALLRERTPSLVLSGPSAEGHVHGAQNAAAIMLLNVVLGNMGKTVTAPAKIPFPQMAPAGGDTSALIEFNQALSQGPLADRVHLWREPGFHRAGLHEAAR